MLAVLVHGCILVPVHGVLEAAALEHVLRKTAPSVCMVAPAYRGKLNYHISYLKGAKGRDWWKLSHERHKGVNCGPSK